MHGLISRLSLAGLGAAALVGLASCDEPATPETATPRPVRAIKVGTAEQIGQRTDRKSVV